MRFAIESWIWYTFAVGIIVARLISRTLLFGSPKRLQYDDYIMGLFVTSCYTVLIVMLNKEASTRSNLLPPGYDYSTLNPQDIAAREYGSKIVVVVEQMQIAVIWACKACLLILYHRLTHMVAVKENIAVKLLAVYIALGFVVMEILYFSAWCRPFSEYWAVPTLSSQCNALTSHRITNAVFNISSDLIMLCIALPMFIRSSLPLKRKLILCCIFSLGVFAIVAAVLNKYYSFTTPYEPTWIYWYARESSTAILVANLPFTWTLLRKLFNLGAFDEQHPPPPTYHSSRTAGGRRTARAHTHHGVSGGSGEKHSGSHNASSGDKPGRPMSLIGSICAAKAANHEPVSGNSQHSENGLLEAAMIQPKDYGANAFHSSSNTESFPSVSRNMDSDMAIDLERGPSPSNIGLRPSIDSTICPYPNSSPTMHLTHPRRAHLAPGPSHSRPSSVASTSTTTTTNASLRANILRTGTAVGRPTGAGGGRSARDRKVRARMTE
ncbi:hypothetical protein K505DRAFT_363987 [Melanomma pulvis-pyrius CBS 109.77]|uniref:Rhodopsin domain-containing protein n=1 Tax=Melanomma pulvis-pyrius CBS 109.77 TaxID=1314802 RepID=A0A6A6X545_9PLEO|nr:hypothetical protein K505DRAFT_363987 [Melanomma pulvis-pyrius CBS 109.77]